MGKLTRFQIQKLYGFRNIDIPIVDNTAIFVGENGMGKTTVLKFMFSILSGAYHQIPSSIFDQIIVTIDDNDYIITYDDIHKSNIPINPRILRELPSVFKHELELKGLSSSLTLNDLINISRKIGYPKNMLLNRLKRYEHIDETFFESFEAFENENIFKNIVSSLNARVLYLPTYRRIEQDLAHVLKGRYSLSREHDDYNFNDFDMVNSYIELVEFGMQDVKEKIEKKCSELSRYSESSFKDLAYMNLGDVIDKNYALGENNYSVPPQDIQKFKLCLSRNNKEMLSSDQVETLIAFLTKTDFNSSDTHRQILLYYFKNLLTLQEELEKKEQSIIDFCEMCNKYFASSGKEIHYDISTFKVNVVKHRADRDDIIDMSDLSSGEKQIVSLFSHLFLSEENNYFVIIDEPELSLSVPWQRIFLEDIQQSKLCVGLISATHSPFIYDNKLFSYTRGLGEFIEEDFYVND